MKKIAVEDLGGGNLLIGYGRVSKSKQDTALQEDAFSRAGVTQVTTEKWSSVGARPKLVALLAALNPGDVLVVWKLDRVGRSLQDLLRILDVIHQRGAGFRSLTEHVDTSNAAGKMLYSILGAVAEYERSMIRERSIAGQVAAIERGAVIGRPRSLTPFDEEEVYRLWCLGNKKADLMRAYNVHHDAINRAIYRFEQPNHPLLQRKRPILGPLLRDVK